jgi:hypothetical protein
MKPTEPSRIETAPPTSENSSCIGLILRLFWMAFGSFALALCAIKVTLEYPRNLPVLTASVFLLAILMIVARYADIRYFSGKTCDGDPATMAHLRPYAVRVAVVAATVYTCSLMLGLVLSK